MIGSSKNNRENDLKKCFWKQEKETRVIKFNPGLGDNWPSNNWALIIFLFLQPPREKETGSYIVLLRGLRNKAKMMYYVLVLWEVSFDLN